MVRSESKITKFFRQKVYTMAKQSSLFYLYSIVGFLNILLHSAGIYLLVQVYRRNNKNCQTIYIIPMAVAEILWNIFEKKVVDI